MTATEIIQTLYRGGGVLLPDGDDLTVDAPDRILTPELIEQIRQHKAELLATLTSGHLCARCGSDTLKQQSREPDCWFCPSCRRWCDSQGRPVAEIVVTRPPTLEEVEARQLVADLLAAGCGFVTEDGERVRVTNISKIPTATWLKFEQATPEFARLALAKAKAHEHTSEAEWVM